MTMIASAARAAGRHRRRLPAPRPRPLSSVAVIDDDADDAPAENPHHPLMFSPLDLGPHVGSLPNRVLMGSMHTGLEGHSIPRWMLPMLGADDDHDDLTEMAVYFGERARGGCGLMGA